MVSSLAVAEAPSRDSVPAAYVAVCEKIQSCARIEFSLSQIPTEHSAVLNAALNSLCAGVYQSIETLESYPDLEAPALICAESLLQLSCDHLAADRQTAACATLIDQAGQLGLTLH
ncbi:hypothetical protein QWY82_17370 [Simiduia curdlanivorans]|uniref:Uncharacterized protein n=1 Tax=Simiduia curdlanivorans TaxID=1492769 RepID=A0ABV8V623_9GAMM|nr:hypothetical protein [Simiduia curdlanivorans]MDN3640571.1 hypothetical protein [Simiduia curdlanivorans]